MIPKTPNVLDIPTPALQSIAIFITFFFSALALVTFAVRVWSRLRITRTWGLDDWLMLPAELCSLLMCVPFYMYVKLGYFGWRQQDVPADYDPTPGLWWFYIAQIFYNPILALVKCSVLVFILRIGEKRKGVSVAVYSIIAFTALQAIAIFFVVILQCLPVQAVWEPANYPNAKCIQPEFHITISSLTVLTDILVLALPFYVFLGLKMRAATKVAVLCCFASGGVVTAVSIARIIGLVQLFYFRDPNSDPFHSAQVTLSVVEVNLAIATACAPAMRPLFRAYFPALFGSARRGTGYSNGKSSGYGTHSRNKTSVAAVALEQLERRKRRDGHEELSSRRSSQEEILNFNGVMHTTDIEAMTNGGRDIVMQKEYHAA